jgi:xanthine/uracil permease
VIQAVLALALIGLLYWITSRVVSGSPVLMAVARGALVILGLGEIFYGAENVTRAFKLSGPAGFGAEFGGEATPVQVVNQPDASIPVDPSPPVQPPEGA